MGNHAYKTPGAEASVEALLQVIQQTKGGKPDYGTILRYYRQRKGWKVDTVVQLYSDVWDEEPKTQSWVYMMETQNTVPMDESRRWVLSRLLSIPPVLLGLPQLIPAPVITRQEGLFDAFHPRTIDIAEYRSTLIRYCSSALSGETLVQIQDARQRIQTLHAVIHYSRASEKRKMLQLLCEYLVFLAGAAHEQHDFTNAINFLSNAIVVAEQYKLYDILAYALRERGRAYADRGEIAEGLINFSASKDDYEQAIANFATAKALKTQLAPLRYGLVLDASARVYAHMARDGKEMKEALYVSDDSAHLMGKDGDELTIPAKLDEERLHLSRGSTLIASSLPAHRDPEGALAQLEKAMEVTKSTSTIRHIENYTRQAEAHYLAGQYPRTKSYRPDEHFLMAVAAGEAALELLKTNPCTQHVTRLENIYWRLSESHYGKSEEVAQFGVEVLKLQHPGFFPQLN